MRCLMGLVIFLVSSHVFAGRDVRSSVVNYIYQLDSEATVFEFNASTTHRCGSSIYRVKSPSVAVANRKFSMVFGAFIANKRLAFHDKEICEGNRSLVSWVRIIN